MKLVSIVAAFFFITAAASAQESGSPPAAVAPAVNAATETDEERNAREFLAKLDQRTGAIKIDAAKVTLTVPEDYYFLDAEDARAVLEEAWGNPPDETILGMLLPAGGTPLDDGVWAATFSYQEDGYVSDEDAGKIKYDELLKTLQDDA